MSDDQQFFVSQKAVIIRENAVLILHDPEFGSDFPGGKIQAGKLNFEDELRREVREETCLEISVGLPFATGYFELPSTSKNKNAGRKIFNVYHACKYLSGEVRISNEHDRYDWVTRSNFVGIVNQELELNVLARYFSLHPDALLQGFIARKKQRRLASNSINTV